MNRGVVQRSPVQPGNSNRWSMINNNIISISKPPPSAQIITTSFPAPLPPPSTDVLFPHYTAALPVTVPPPPPPPSSATFWDDDNQLLPAESISWSHLLLGGLVEQNDNRKSELTNVAETKKGMENWEDVFLHQQLSSNSKGYNLHDAGPQIDGYSTKSFIYGYSHHQNNNDEYQTYPLPQVKFSWSPAPAPVSPPASCVTTLNSSTNNSLVDLTEKTSNGRRHPPLDHSSECNSTGATAGSGVNKKARVQPSSIESTFKVRKEKLGDRITALHQLVSPFGKTDTASVLLEAIGYIRFLQSQVEALSVPYMGKTSGTRQQHQKQKNVRKTDNHEKPKKDLKSRGLCLVPISSTLQVGNDINGADYWAPALGGGTGGGFR